MKSSWVLNSSEDDILFKRNELLPSSSAILILDPNPSCTFLSFGTISLILKHEKLLRRWAAFKKAAD